MQVVRLIAEPMILTGECQHLAQDLTRAATRYDSRWGLTSFLISKSHTWDRAASESC